MKPNELRIGNLVYHNGSVIEVENVIDFCINMIFNNYSGSREDQIDIEEIEPIPLNEEWLLKFGAINMSGWTGLKFDFEVWDEKAEYTFELMDGILTLYHFDNRLKKIETPYVHQLQNLYFAMTGEELKIVKP
jgi:hypothetical protein